MKKTVVVNGKFFEDRMQGIVRYARELMESLDSILFEYKNRFNFILLVPHTAQNIPNYKNITVKKIGKNKGIMWEQIDLRRYLKSDRNLLCLNLCNVAPLFVQPGITVILDIMYKVNPSHYISLRNKLSRLWHCFQYYYCTKHERRLITISEFCKNEIERIYPVSKGKIDVVSCAWQHVLHYKENPDWKINYPYLKEKNYFFSLSTLSINKNGKWIIEVAKKNPDFVFVMAGKHYETEYDEIPSNVHFIGYISDETACSLIKNCLAFIFPSLYEGFGIPPLEALALGANVISSNTSSLPEVLKDSVHYIDPYNTNVNLHELLSEKVGDKKNSLDQFSWDKSARKLMKVFLNYAT